MRRRRLFSFYGRALGAVLRKRPWGLVFFLLSSSMHALGHAALALAAGRCAGLLVGAWGTGGAVAAPDSSHAGAKQALLVALAGLGAAVLKAGGGVVAAYGQARVAGDVGASLRAEVLDRLLSIHPLRRPRHADHRSAQSASSPARCVAALTACIHEVELGLHTGVLGGLRAVAQLVPLAVVLLWLAPRLALVAFAVFAPFAVLLGANRRRWKRAHAAAMRHAELLLEAADEAVRHAELWMTYGAEGKVRSNVAALGDAVARTSARLEAGAAAMTGANEVLGAVALVCTLGAARMGWLGDAGSGTALLSFTVAFFLAYRPIRDLTEARFAWLRGQVAFEELEDLAPPRSPAEDAYPSESHPASAHFTDGAWSLAALDLHGLELARGGASPVTLSIAPGQIVAVLGPTGTGKTTLLRTLLGLEASKGGSIEYAGASLESAPAGPTARPFAWVPQDAPLLADTLAANVALGAPADARAALTPLGAAHLVDSLGDQRLGAGGRSVSGGERQWIALARAIASRQPILLLDEPTSGLDPESQAQVLDAIARLRGERSVLLVTHRAEPLAIADHVVRLGPL
jgi:ABC-type multidrug transport system fused ATPase/permease subunit